MDTEAINNDLDDIIGKKIEKIERKQQYRNSVEITK